MPGPNLSIKNLVCGYKEPLIEPFSTTVEPGQVIFLLGKNGAGKTSLLRTLGGIMRPFAGELACAQKPIFLPAQVSVADTLTGLDICEIYGVEIYSAKVHGANSAANDFLKRPFATLSSGEQRRVLLNATLSNPARTVLLDEPFNFLDWSHSFEILSQIEDLARSGKSFILATHQMEWALRLPNSLVWALVSDFEKNTGTVLAGDTRTILLSERFQKGFGLNIQILNNPLDQSQVLAMNHRH